MSNHLEEAGESYWQHFRYASLLGLRLMGIAVYIIAHAIFPSWKRFDNQVLPFIEQVKRELVVRQMRVVHHRLTKRLENRLRNNIVDDSIPTDDL